MLIMSGNRQRTRPLLTQEYANARLIWARQYRDIDWRRIIWSDECSIERGVGKQGIWTFTRPKDQPLKRDVREKRTGKCVKKVYSFNLSPALPPALSPANITRIRCFEPYSDSLNLIKMIYYLVLIWYHYLVTSFHVIKVLLRVLLLHYTRLFYLLLYERVIYSYIIMHQSIQLA